MRIEETDGRADRGRASIGAYLPLIPAVTLGVETDRRAWRQDSRDQVAGRKEDGQDRAAEPPCTVEHQQTHYPCRNGTSRGQCSGPPCRERRGPRDRARQRQRDRCQLPFAARSAERIRSLTACGQVSLRARVSSISRKLASNRA